MQNSDHYSLNLAEGTDLVNPLTIDVPNYEAIDAGMYANRQNIVSSATHLKSGTTHALTRSNTDSPVFRFVATAKYTEGDLFTVDGVSVSGLITTGESLPDGAFAINQSVLCILNGTVLTVLVPSETKDVIDQLHNALNMLAIEVTDIHGLVDTIETIISTLQSRLNIKQAYVNNTSSGQVTINTSTFKVIGANVGNWNNCYVRMVSTNSGNNTTFQVFDSVSNQLVGNTSIRVFYYYID